MTFRLTLVLALAAFASAKYESKILPAAVAKTVCAMEDLVPTLLENAFQYHVEHLEEPTPHQDGDEGADQEEEAKARHIKLAGNIVSHPGIHDVFWGFENGAFDEWRQVDEDQGESLPDEYEGETDLAHQIFERVNDDGTTSEYYADHKYQIIHPHFKQKEEVYDPTIRPWYHDSIAEELGAWSSPYKSFFHERVQISPAVNLKDSEGNLLGVTGMTFKVEDLHEILEEAAEHAKEGTVLFISEGGDEHHLVAASEKDVSYDAEGNQLPALESPSEAIKEVTQALMDHVAAGGDPEHHFAVTGSGGEEWFIDSHTIDHVGGLPFAGGESWTFVMAQPVECDEGLELDMETAECVCHE